MAKCKNCGEGDKSWIQDAETSKWRLLNADGSRHYCLGGSGGGAGAGAGGGQQPQQQQQQQQQALPPQQQIPAAEFLDKISKITETLEMYAKFYEGLVGEMQIINKAVHKSFLVQDKAEQFLEQSRITDAKVDRILARVESIVGVRNVRDDEQQRRLQRQEEEYDRDREDGTIGFGGD